ncbi:MAG: gliding motility-associated ABC transporter permease subunit GldF [Bacteroidales bacterium]|nr:gliding motility-associated ABC transporter permease subunit GldF [Bacteroidales bacterium]
MFSLFKKELSAFFSSITGYIVVFIFLLVNGLVLWVFRGNMNIIDSGFAYLDPLFQISPWVFLFLVPAITMRMISEELKTGTIEVLYTQPLSDMQIVLAKYLAGMVLILISLLPTLIYVASISSLSAEGQQTADGADIAGLDMGETLGAYLGLFMLASVYCAIGMWASALTENQIVAFLLAVGISLFMYLGMDAISGFLGKSGLMISNLGIDAHYRSISRGVVDTRDIVYFVSANALFLILAKYKLASRNWK